MSNIVARSDWKNQPREISPKELAGSRLYPHIKTKEQAAVVISKARAWGLEASCVAEALYFINGKPALSAGMHAILVKRSGRYDYRIVKKDARQCEIDFRERVDGKWESLGVEVFTIEDAKRAGLDTKENWKKYPAGMLFSRCMTAGVRARCPDVLAGTQCYSIEELAPDADYDEDGEPIVADSDYVDADIVDTARTEEIRAILKSANLDEANCVEMLGVGSLEDANEDDLAKVKQWVSLKARLAAKKKGQEETK